jgi:pimeloyl-ACP methyl ester carboxylesterase
LPDPLTATDGTRIQSRDQWAKRRAEIVQLFASEVYGRAAVGRPAQLGFDVTEKDARAFDGTARRRLVDIKYAGPGGEGTIALRLYLPPVGVKPKGCFVLIVNRDRAIITEAEAKPMEFWPAKDIVARGYIAAAFHNSDVAIDEKTDSWTSGVFKIFGPSLADRKPDDWGTIAAWSWGASRVVDYLRSDVELARLPIAVVGHSRGGKAALWCGAQDDRVGLTISNNSGCSGAALARRTRGETVQRINAKFPHWFCGNYKKYNNREETMPVDQHLLIAAIAPRRAYVASASENATADPAAEFGACVAAEPAFRLFGGSGVGVTTHPVVDTPVHQGSVGYHMRTGMHDLKAWDWQQYMSYTDRHWKTP